MILMQKALLLATLVVACSGPPESLNFDPAFTNQERSEGAAAVSAWCDAVGWCPSIVPNQGAAHVLKMSSAMEVVDHLPDGKPGLARVSGENIDGVNAKIWIDSNHPEDLFSNFVHELGHFCVLGHPSERGRMMSAEYVAGSALRVIDQEAINAWNECRQH